MAYDIAVADRLRNYFLEKKITDIVEKKMFGGLAFMVNGKMCINVSKDRLMCRFEHNLTEELSKRIGYEAMVMKGRVLDGYCYVQPDGYDYDEDFEFWVDLCLAYNETVREDK
ncbi:TfoX/Sxy family protein [Portibacter lacus]|uniref:TfoX N-terminal domain-containing protein n=1 Tax=Portibacter lacus TaxID=1099794 RepID=A0AA37SSP5_9BACT|nr:TfoX/Sxy family protein [Portibacter lacus]GLR17315.1 hypothetical protein GCM10007940_19300 [Portibacter lacus]